MVDAGATFAILRASVPERYVQSHRPAAEWTTSNMANTAVVGGLAILIGAAVIFMTPPEHERITGTVVAVLNMALALTFAATRRERSSRVANADADALDAASATRRRACHVHSFAASRVVAVSPAVTDCEV